VAMPITTPDFYTEKFSDDEHFAHVLEHLFIPALEKERYEVIRPSAAGSELIHAEIIKNLEQADLVLCDLSSMNPNVFFELGIRTSLDRAIVLVKDDLTAAIPFDLNAINMLTYEASLTPWTLDTEVERLSRHIASASRTADQGNAMWRYFGLTKRASPSQVENNPMEAKIDFLITEIMGLRSIGAMTRQGNEASGAATIEEEAVRFFDQAIRPYFPSQTKVVSAQYDEGSRTLVVHTSNHPIPQSLRNNLMERGLPSKISLHIRHMGTDFPDHNAPSS
jgi:hypothetical protein